MAAACNHAQFTAECTECIAAVPAPVARALPVRVRRCVHNESTDAPCATCADLRAGEARLRAVARIPEILARTPSAVDAIRGLAEYYDYDARHAQERARAVGAGETKREHEQLAAEHGAVAEVLRVVLTLHTPTVAPKTEGLGVPRQRLDEWCDPDVEGQLRASDIAALPPSVARDVLRSIAAALGLGVVELPAASRSSAALAAARLARESGEVIADAYEAHADGVVTPAEGARLERQCDDALTALLEVREHAREAQRVPVRRIGEARRA